MKTFFIRCLLAVCFAAGLSAQTIPLYQNFGTVTYRLDSPEQSAPTVDALAFANYGSFNITNMVDFQLLGFLVDLGLPYEPNNVLNFTNRGSMSAPFGFRFNTATDTGRRQASSFVNGNGATIDAKSSVFDIPRRFGNAAQVFTGFLVDNAYVIVSATNVINHGLLQAANQGEISIQGGDVDLSRGAVNISTAQDLYSTGPFAGFCFLGGTTVRNAGGYYIPDVGISDVYWGYGTNQWFANSFYFPALGGTVAVSSPHNITGYLPPYFTLIDYQMVLTNPVTSSYALQFTPTNWIYQAVFIQTDDTNVLTDVRFGPSTILTNPYTAPVIQFSSVVPDIVTGGQYTNYLYFMDQFMAESNQFFLTNATTAFSTPTFMPTNYAVSRTAPCEYLFGQAPNWQITPLDLYMRTYSNNLITNFSSSYSWRADNTTLPVIPGASITSAVGRVEITSQNLKMDNARIRGEGFVSLQANHLISSSNSLVDVEHLSLDLGSTNGSLVVDGLARDVVRRMAGDVACFSGAWTNNVGILVTNLVDDGMGGMTNQVDTNVVELGFYVWMVDNRLQTRSPTTVHEFITHSINLTITNTSLNISEVARVDAERMTVGGKVAIQDPLHDWKGSSFPNLKYLTNLGTIAVTNAGFFGSDLARPYANVVNRGNITGVSLNFWTENFENSATISSLLLQPGGVVVSGPFTLQAGSARMENGKIETGSDMSLSGGVFKFNHHTNLASGALLLNVTNSLNDAGAGSANVWKVGDGFNLLVKPPTGDLLGTSLSSTAPQFAAVQHTWAGANRGATPAGYSNNVALGHLTLDAPDGSLLNFSGAGTGNGLYVDFLELKDAVLTNLESTVAIDPNLVVYFADANVPAETLNGKLGGRLVWVQDYAGPNSSVDVLLVNGQTVKMNRALRFSLTIDTDGDGVANGFDSYPLDASAWNSLTATVTAGSPGVSLSWVATPGTVYVVESTTNLTAPNWQPVTTYTNAALTGGVVNLPNVSSLGGEAQRFYRVRRNQ